MGFQSGSPMFSDISFTLLYTKGEDDHQKTSTHQHFMAIYCGEERLAKFCLRIIHKKLTPCSIKYRKV